ncbi:2,3-dihydro-2,3-dihydroxybenzoate dehydrogenase [Alkalilimnicola ehrlichii]|uniref:2,3-dihydro-2,3-dihydroxybenzoate dehydrogenase n=1 Tax=Alkalilimnicola ehrlichii TaxID=351052 RepID=A0A3E0X332_9GAMM|nr:2,3-dihydro-2,3-dihydroxybenzoate dehydrogenase [Alkalilimnicola ehrlichii]RFA29009.1 2,3-dihydro-2,3-dihydroxybenzoate dehydrogenase [Alkalilimnicola ehrlichii]RFA38644.1 2,3-dihydro-2,3-dihydroxybenzoate dehydrogenase [Alkalilimnicola ehrlichii]
MERQEGSGNEVFAGKCALVTGAWGGIGSAVVERLMQLGATVIAADVHKREPADCGDMARCGGSIVSVALDVSNSAAVERAVGEIEATWGNIDFLVHVAGILRPGSLLETSDEDWQESFAVNAAGTFNTVRAVARQMMPRRQGAMVAIGSNAAAVPRLHMAAYAASKAAMSQFIRCAGLELAPYGIRCNLVSPGSTDTAMQQTLWQDAAGRAAAVQGCLGSFRNGIPLGRIAVPEDVADAVVFLLSEKARHVTLHDLRVDGGASLSA